MKSSGNASEVIPMKNEESTDYLDEKIAHSTQRCFVLRLYTYAMTKHGCSWGFLVSQIECAAERAANKAFEEVSAK